MILQLGIIADQTPASGSTTKAADANADPDATAAAASSENTTTTTTNNNNNKPRHVMPVDDDATPEFVARHALEGAMAAQWLIKAARCHPIANGAAQRGEDCAVRFVYNPNANDSTIVHIVRGGNKTKSRRRKEQLSAQKSIPQLAIELHLKDSAHEDGDGYPVMGGSLLGGFKGLGNPIVQGSLRMINNGSSSLVDEDIDTKIVRVYEREDNPDIASHCVEIGLGRVRNGADILEVDSEHVDDEHEEEEDDIDLGPLARSDARFVPHARQANVRMAKRTPDLPERIKSPLTRREMAAAIREASIDPFQSRIITPEKLDNDLPPAAIDETRHVAEEDDNDASDEADSIVSGGDWSSGDEDAHPARPAVTSAGKAKQPPKRGTIEEVADPRFNVPKKLEAKFHACETLEEKRAVLAAFRKKGREAVARSKMRREAWKKSGSQWQLQLEATRSTTGKGFTSKRGNRKRKNRPT